MKIEKSSYRGYKLTVTDLSILVNTPRGDRLGSVKAMSSARRLVQRHRNETLGGRS
jgi:hypothetical protein